MKRYKNTVKEFFKRAGNARVPPGQTWYCASGEEDAYESLAVDGYYKNRGLITVRNTLRVNGTLENNDTVRVGW